MLTEWLTPTVRHARMPLLPTNGVWEPRPQGPGLGIRRWQQALRAAGLESLNRTQGRLTLLAPSDQAFDHWLAERRLSWAGFIADLPALRNLLMGHVLTARHSATGLPNGLLPTAVASHVLEVTRDGHGPLLRDAEGGMARLQACDMPAGAAGTALLHIIDRVLPPPLTDLKQLLAARPEFSEFSQALTVSGFDSLLQGRCPITVLAPHNEGWRHLASRLGLRQRELAGHPDLLRRLLAHHLLPGRWLSIELPWGSPLTTAAGTRLTLAPLGLIGSGEAAQPLLGGSDLRASNGVLHRLATPLLPDSH